MKKKYSLLVAGFLALAIVLAGMLPALAAEEEPAGRFVLVAEAGGKLVIAPEYVTYTEGQDLKEALAASGHEFTGLEYGSITAIDGVTGNYTRGDQNGGYDLSVPASSVTHFRFSENVSSSQPSQGLLLLMTAMADYAEKPEDVRLAAKEAYDTALAQFVGCSSEDAKMLANDINRAVRDYETNINGEKYTITFSDGKKEYSLANFPNIIITAQNPYGKVWAARGDGKLKLPVGRYDFCVEQNGFRVEGVIVVSGEQTVQVQLPKELWLNLDTFRLSGTYGADDNADNRFADGEFALGQWQDRHMTVAVEDLFHGAVYSYAEYQNVSGTPTLTAIYSMAGSGEPMEKSLAFASKTSGAYEVLAQGAEGNTVIYRLTHAAKDGYTYSQDYTVEFKRIPTLASITVKDQNGVDQAPTNRFSGDLTEYTYKVLDTTTSVTISAQPMIDGYSVTVNGMDAADGVSVPVSGETGVEVVVTANGYSNTYVLAIRPGEGKTLSFVSDKSVTIQVVNSNGVVMPFTTHRETATKNRYKYTLVPGETYSYIATKDTYYHIADEFRLEDTANSTITVDFGDMGDWLTELALGTGKGGKQKGTIELNNAFSAANHAYYVVYPDTEHNVYLWVKTSQEDVKIQAIYHQLFSTGLYHGKEYRLDMISGYTTGEKLNRFLMDENPLENTLTIRLTKEVDGVTYYQDYVVECKRSLTLQDISAVCDGVAATLIRPNGKTGFAPDVLQYDVAVSMAAQKLLLHLACYDDNTCYGETGVGYQIFVDGQNVTEAGSAQIALDGTINTQVVKIVVKNDKAPNGTTTYILNILKSPPVLVTFQFAPADAQLSLYEVLSGQRLWPDGDGNYLLCEGYAYDFTLTKYGYVGAFGTLQVTRDAEKNMVILNGAERYPVTETGAGGAVTISWALQEAAVNAGLQPDLPSAWPNFRGDESSNAVTDTRIPIDAENGTLYWATKLGEGYDADAVGSPILVDGAIITYAGDKIYRVDTVSGQILAVGKMDHKSSFSITPPAYAEGMVFVALSDGCVQAFDAVTLEPLWIYHDPLGGQPNCPLIVSDGYLYTGFWNSETADANYVCLTITDEDPSRNDEEKPNSWYYTAAGGFYWAGAYVDNGFVLIGTDDGDNSCIGQSSRLLLFDAISGRLLDSWDNLNGDIRSTVVYDAVTDAYYFTSKGGSFYSVRVTQERKLADRWSVELQNGAGGIPMSTCSPVVYNGRAYVGVSGSSQFSPYCGHNITVIDVDQKQIAYRVNTQGYPQTSGLLTTAYEQETGYVYVYFFDNYTPGKLRVLRDRPGMLAPDYLNTETILINGQSVSFETAYALFTPTGDQAQYAICSPIVDEYGTIYFKNDSAYLMAFGSTIEKIEITRGPDRTAYLEGERFDPTGMVITATYANGMTRDITAYVTYSDEALTVQDTTLTISFAHVMYQNREEGSSMVSGVQTQIPYVDLQLTIAAGELGDVNMDGRVDEQDAMMILLYEAEGKAHQLNLRLADVSGDGVADSNDAVLILQYLAGKRTW